MTTGPAITASAARVGSRHPGREPQGGAARALHTVVRVASWLVPLAFLAWAARLVFLEGYWYEIQNGFPGDFTRTAALGSPEFWSGQGLFYGPIFVLEYRFLYHPGILSGEDFARIDFVLFGIAFACAWLALFGAHRPRLAILALAAWLANHMSVEAFSNTAHPEIVELMLIAIAMLLATRGRPLAAGSSLGLAIATKTLPGLFLPFLALTRRWRMLAAAVVVAAVPFLAVCWIQAISPIDGLISLVYQGGNLTKLEYTEYEYTPRAEIARMLAGPGGQLTTDQARLAIALHWVIAIVILGLTTWVLYRARIGRASYGCMFGLIAGVMLVVTPSAHAAYYIFLLPGWTAILAALVERPVVRGRPAMWAALVLGYVFTGFDQPFFLSQRLLGFGAVVPENWLAWHLPSLGLLMTLATLGALLLQHPGERQLRVATDVQAAAGSSAGGDRRRLA